MSKTQRVGKKLITIHYPKVDCNLKTYKIDICKALNWFNIYDSKDLIKEAIIASKELNLINITKYLKTLNNVDAKLKQFCVYFILLNSGSTFSGDHVEYFNNLEVELLNAKKPKKQDEKQDEKQDAPKKRSVYENIKIKSTSIIAEIDNILDNFTSTGKAFPTINQLFKQYSIIPQMQQQFDVCYGGFIEELQSDSAQLTEGYAFLSKKQKKTIITFFSDILSHFKQIKAIKKPRLKKPQAPSKIVKKVNLATEGKWHGFTFAKKYLPIDILNKELIILWVEKQRRIIVMQALPNEQLTIQGSSVKNVDLDKSYYMSLRHPEDILKNDLQTIKKRAFNALVAELKKAPITSTRLNNNMFLVNAI